MRGVLVGTMCLGLGLVAGSACRESSTEAPQGIVDGYWQGSCQPHALGSTRVHYLFQATSRVERSDAFYSDADCSALLGQVSFSGDYNLFTRTEDYTYDIEMNLSRVSGVAVDDEAAAVWSASAFCGKTDWVAAESTDLAAGSGSGCPSLGILPVDYRDLVRIESKPSRLFFASSLNHKKPRPSGLDPGSAAAFTPAGH